MLTETENLRSTLRRLTLALGVLQILVGCLIGFIPPSVVSWFRGIVMAHIEFTANGVLMVVLGLLVNELYLASTTLKVWFVSLQIGTWTNGSAGVAAAFLGTSSELMPTINQRFPPSHGTDSVVVSGLLLICGVAIILALFLTLYGLLCRKASSEKG